MIDGAKWHTANRTKDSEETKEEYLKHLAQLEIMVLYAKWKNYDLLYPASQKESFMEQFRTAYQTADVGDFKVSINSTLTMREILGIKEENGNEIC